MEASRVTFSGETADRFAAALVEAKAAECKRSINKWGVRNIHTFEGEGITQLAYERGSAHESSWLMVSVLVEQVDPRTCTVVVLVGGGGEGPFKLEEITMRRIVRGEDTVGQAGRFATVLRDVNEVAESLDLDVDTGWKTDAEASSTAKLERKIFDS